MKQSKLTRKTYDHGHNIKINQQKANEKKKVGRPISNKLNVER